MTRDVTVREVMNREFVGASESDDLLDAVELMLAEDADSVVVLRGNEPVGSVSLRDVLDVLVSDGDVAGATVGDVMTESIPTVPPDRTLSETMDKMSTESISRLVVTDGDDLLGVVTEHDVLTASSLESARTATMEAEWSATVVGIDDREMAAESRDETGFSEQGICEVCGSFSRELAGFNGQLRCPNCREV